MIIHEITLAIVLTNGFIALLPLLTQLIRQEFCDVLGMCHQLKYLSDRTIFAKEVSNPGYRARMRKVLERSEKLFVFIAIDESKLLTIPGKASIIFMSIR